MSDLRASLAAALGDQPVEMFTDGKPWRTTKGMGYRLADVALADPTFRAALVEAIAEALHEAHVPPWYNGHRSDDLTYAAAIVARMLDPRSTTVANQTSGTTVVVP